MSLSSQFRFDENDFKAQHNCVVLSGPSPLKMNRGQLGQEWKVKRDVYCFKITIENGHTNNINQAMETVSRLPLSYLVGLEIVSGENENGMALYKDLGGAAGHGGRTYCNLIGLNLGVLIHELGHGIEQEVRLTVEPDLLDRWKSEAKDVDTVSVSGYGNQNPWEDMAEFCKVYSVCLQTNRLEELKHLSPNRFRIWDHCIRLVNTSLREVKCPESEEVPTDREPLIAGEDTPSNTTQTTTQTTAQSTTQTTTQTTAQSTTQTTAQSTTQTTAQSTTQTASHSTTPKIITPPQDYEPDPEDSWEGFGIGQGVVPLLLLALGILAVVLWMGYHVQPSSGRYR